MFGKGERVIRCKNIILILLFSNLLMSVYTLGVYLNGGLYNSYTEKQIKKLSYPIPSAKDFVNGVTLDELSPLLINAYKVTIKCDSGNYTFDNDNAADLLPSWYAYIDANNSLNIRINGKIFKNAESVFLYGSAIPTGSHLTFWAGWEGVDKLKKEIKRFEKLHRVHIKVTEVPRIESKLISVIRGGGTEPDVVMVESDYLPAIIAVRAIQNLNYMLRDSKVSDTSVLSKKGIYAFTSNNRVWALPFYFDTQLIFYNKKLIKNSISGPISLSSLEKYAYTLKAQGYIPISWNVYSAYWLLPFQAGFGKEIGRNGTAGTVPDNISTIAQIDDFPTEAAVSYLYGLIKQKLLKPMERDAMMSLFTSDRVGFILSGSYSIPDFNSIGLQFGILPFPYNDKTGRPIPPLLDFKGLAITKRTKHPVLSRRLIQYLTGIGVQSRFPESLSKMPSNLQAWKIMKKKSSFYPDFVKSYETGITVPSVFEYKLYKNTMWKLLRFIFSGKMTVRSALAKGQQIINRNINSLRSSR
ncbi:MAG: extracellular solute-binding protein [Spirochaetales bacterium]|nr:extracellular solute-binding protein [Spirochaetales bacterium]